MIVSAVMVPHPPIALNEVGHGEENKISATLEAYREAMSVIRDSRPETVIVLSPHALMYRDYFNISAGKDAYGDMGRFRARNVSFHKEYDVEFTDALTHCLRDLGFPGGTEYDREPELDHGTMVPLYFLDQVYTEYKLVRIGLSGLPLSLHYQLGQKIKETAELLNRHVAVIASGDLAHCQKEDGPYGYRPEGPEYDRRIMKTMGNAAFAELFTYSPEFLNQSMECGHRAFVILAGILDRTYVIPHVLSHEATFGVGYGIVTYEIGGQDESRNYLEQYEQQERLRIQAQREQSDAYVRLARSSVESYVNDGKVMRVPEGLPEELYQTQAGAFVSIHKNGELRGCIGTIEPVQSSLAMEIIRNAVSACSRDPRFPAIDTVELPYLEISVDVLGKPERIPDKSYLDPKRYGVICTCGRNRGLLLPDLEGVDTVDEQVSIACRKGQIDPEDEDLVLERFEVVRHV